MGKIIILQLLCRLDLFLKILENCHTVDLIHGRLLVIVRVVDPVLESGHKSSYAIEEVGVTCLVSVEIGQVVLQLVPGEPVDDLEAWKGVFTRIIHESIFQLIDLELELDVE